MHNPTRRHVNASDLRGLARLATHATVSTVGIVEDVHRAVLRTFRLPGGIVSPLYGSVRAVTRLVGTSLDGALSLLDRAAPAPGTHQREAVISALNGVVGDHLHASKNPLALPMTLRYLGEPVQRPPGSKILLLVHGLCMNDLQWQSQGRALAAALGYTPVYVRYNSGLSVSHNGRMLATLLDQFPAAELRIIAHSMGGLVTRSAVHYGGQWTTQLNSVAFLGTPHHGAPLERAGNWVDDVLRRHPYTAPLCSIGQLRSAGITDLRHGHVTHEDWNGCGRFDRKPDSRKHVALPREVPCFAVAASIAPRSHALADALIGDGLVPLQSALGQHSDPQRNLAFTDQFTAFGMNHLQLISSSRVTDKLQDWLSST